MPIQRWLLLFLAFLLGIGYCYAANSNAHEDVDDPDYPLDNSAYQFPPSDQAPFVNAAGVSPASRPLAVAQESPGLRAGSFRYSMNDGYFYHRQRAAGGRVFLRCVMGRSNPPCRARATMNADLTNFVAGDVHNHGPDVLHDRVQQLRNSLAEACRARPNARVDVIYNEVCRNFARDVSSRVSLVSVRPSMVRAQAEHRPRIPHSFEELDLALQVNEELTRSLDGETNLYRGMTGVPGHRSLVFMSDRVLEGFHRIQVLFGDATFYSRPSLPDSAQLYTFVSMRDNHVVPLFHALMESRTEQAYRALFQFFRELAPNVDPEFVVTDFEVAQLNALRQVFPLTRHSGCLWHYARAVCRNVRTLGLHALVRDNDNARRIVRLSISIPLAPANRIQEALNSIIVEARRLMLFHQFEEFFNYIQTSWILRVGAAIISVFGVRHRTNNAAECHHRNLNSKLVRRPNIWRFLELLIETEDTAWRDMGRLEQGLAPSRARRVSSILNDARVRSCSRQLLNNEMDLLHFLASVSWHLDSTMRDMLVEREAHDRPPSPERAAPEVQQQDGAMDMDVAVDSQIGHQLDAVNHLDLEHLDNVNMFQDLMEGDENYDPARGRSRGRGRSLGGRRRDRQPPARHPPARHPPARHPPARRPPVPSVAPARQPRVPPAPISPPVSRQPVPELSPPQPLFHRQLPNDNIFRSVEFSDEEFLPDSEEEEMRRWTECIICNARVGRYSIIGCGAFPICGHCVRQWFIIGRMKTCPHCNNPTPGWLRLDV